MNLLQITLLFLYLLLGIKFLIKWKTIYSQDVNLSPDDKKMSTVSLAIAGFFWIIVVPIAYLEILTKKINETDLNINKQ